MECKICKRTINSKKDNWNKLETYTKEKKEGTYYFHDSCYLDLINGRYRSETQKGISSLMERVHLMLDNLGVDRVINLK